MNLHAASVNLHLVTGVIALTTFWIAALARKGSRPHIWSGRIYLVAMLGIILTGIPLVAGFVANGKPVAAAFFGFLLALVGWSCWCAWRAIRDRRHPERYAGPVYWLLTWLVLAGGAGVAALGLVKGAALLVVFGSVGVVAGWDALRVRRRARASSQWWLKEHYGAMIGNGVATHIAFLSIGLRTLLPGVDGTLLTYFAWFGPLAVALGAGWWLNRRYIRRGTTLAEQGAA